MKRMAWIVGATSCLLSACGVVNASKYSQMDATQVAGLTDEQVCHPLASGAVISRERQSRGLGDCDPAHLECKKLGYAAGTSEYLQCRQMFMQRDIAADTARRQALSSAANDFQNAYKQNPPPVTTNCNPNGAGGVSCTTY